MSIMKRSQATPHGLTVNSASYKALAKRLCTALGRRLDSRKEALDKIARSRVYESLFPVTGRISLKDGQEFVFEFRTQPEQRGQEIHHHKVKNRKVLMKKLV